MVRDEVRIKEDDSPKEKVQEKALDLGVRFRKGGTLLCYRWLNLVSHKRERKFHSLYKN